jgi:hypothetical protein
MARQPATSATRPPGRTSTPAQVPHVWVVPCPGGVFSDDASSAATTAAARAALAEAKPGQLAP